MKKVLLVKYGEIALRGKNRGLFERKLIRILKDNISEIPSYKIHKEQGRLVIVNEAGDVDYELLLPFVLPVVGINAFCPAVATEDNDIDSLQALAVAYMRENFGDKPFTFKVETKRADKRYPLSSQQISAIIGGAVDEAMPAAKVDVRSPQEILWVELRTSVYLYGRVIRGQGGLPAGSSGSGLLLLSGGIDSPVAGYLMAKRGVALSAVYFHAAPYTSERAKEKVLDLAKRLAIFTGEFTLYVVNFTEIQLFLYDSVPSEKLTLFLKRSMLAVGERLALKNNCQCLITGDSVGQVASQTLHSILAIDSAASIPVMRPLSGMDKQEIVDLSKEIETYDISIQPYEDCCTIFTAKHPETHPMAAVFPKMESRLSGLEEKRELAANECEVIEIKR